MCFDQVIQSLSNTSFWCLLLDSHLTTYSRVNISKREEEKGVKPSFDKQKNLHFDNEEDIQLISINHEENVDMDDFNLQITSLPLIVCFETYEKWV